MLNVNEKIDDSKSDIDIYVHQVEQFSSGQMLLFCFSVKLRQQL